MSLQSAKFAGVALACLVLGIFPLGDQAVQNPRIARLDIRGNRRIPEEMIRSHIQSNPGEDYDENRLALDLRELYRTGFYSNISIDAQDTATGKIVTFVVKEKQLIRSIEYAGFDFLDESEILTRFKEHRVDLTVDSMYEPARIRAAERELKAMIKQHGKPSRMVRTEIEQIPPQSVRIRFTFVEDGKAVPKK